MKKIFCLAAIAVFMALSVSESYAELKFNRNVQISNQSVYSANGMVSSAQPLASHIGVEILEKGGNAFDAAVATALALSAVEPWMCGPGGASFWIMWDAKNKKIHTLDAGTKAPYAAEPKAFSGRPDLKEGYKSMAIPGSMMAYTEVLKRFGTMSFAEVSKPAVFYLENGFPMTQVGSSYFGGMKDVPAKFPNLGRIFAPGGKWPLPGDIMKNPELAKTYRIIAEKGPDEFYKGSIAKKMVGYMNKNGGLWTMKDLADYNVIWGEPIHTVYKGLDVYAVKPPASGLMWMQALKIAERFDLKSMGYNSAKYIHTLAEIDRLAHSDSYRYSTDQAFVKSPLDELLSDGYADAQAKRVNKDKTTEGLIKYGTPGAKADGATLAANEGAVENMLYSGATSHVAVVDKWGNCVSFTHTLGAFFGGHDVMADTGVVINNGMEWTDFGTNPWSEEGKSPLVTAPGKRNRWTLSPGMIFKDGKPYILVGGSGGETTMSGIFQVLMNMLEWNMDPQAAINAPRFIWGDMRHYTGGSAMALEPELSPIIPELKKMGYNVIPPEKFPAWAGFRPMTGNVQKILIDPQTGVKVGGAESRIDGNVSGY